MLSFFSETRRTTVPTYEKIVEAFEQKNLEQAILFNKLRLERILNSKALFKFYKKDILVFSEEESILFVTKVCGVHMAFDPYLCIGSSQVISDDSLEIDKIYFDVENQQYFIPISEYDTTKVEIHIYDETSDMLDKKFIAISRKLDKLNANFSL